MNKLYFLLASILLIASCSSIEHSIDLTKCTNMGVGTTYVYDSANSDQYFRNKYESSENKKSERNRIIFEMLGLVDDHYSNFVREFRKDRAAKDILVKITSLALTGTASLAHETTAQTLSAIDTGLKGANETIDTNAFKDNVTELLINKMNANRSIVEKEIYESMNNDESKYPLEAAIRDIVRYYNEGTITYALASLAATTAIEASETAKDAADEKVNISP